ncbi:hypothetical protein RDI58_023032 [Solanum bulbocastanum]|uniref:Uncharacterized protein n=1 Tax=Solanum bulbocastanum TaxID=147425 RepID=A0AAN8TAF0_SOLBU
MVVVGVVGYVTTFSKEEAITMYCYN